MVTVAGEFLPFMWPMRNFIYHNPLHGLEHLPFEAAVALKCTVLAPHVTVEAVNRHFGIKRESLTTQMIRELREIALGKAQGPSRFARRFDLTAAAEAVNCRF